MKHYCLNKESILHAVPGADIGAYLLGWELESGVFHPGYVGRSDQSLRRRLMDHARVGAFPRFQVLPTRTILDAYATECLAYHRYACLLNRVHPRAPRNLPYACPRCSLKVMT